MTTRIRRGLAAIALASLAMPLGLLAGCSSSSPEWYFDTGDAGGAAPRLTDLKGTQDAMDDAWKDFFASSGAGLDYKDGTGSKCYFVLGDTGGRLASQGSFACGPTSDKSTGASVWFTGALEHKDGGDGQMKLTVPADPHFAAGFTFLSGVQVKRVDGSSPDPSTMPTS